jgi:hypothetical protein
MSVIIFVKTSTGYVVKRGKRAIGTLVDGRFEAAPGVKFSREELVSLAAAPKPRS